MEDGTADDRHVCQPSPALHSDSGSRTSFDTDMDALLGALQATPSPVFVRSHSARRDGAGRQPTPSGTPAQEADAFDQWFRSQCRTGGVPVPMTDVTMAHVFDAAQPSAVAPQPHSAPATHTVCRDDVDMGAGLAASGNAAVPVDGFCATVDVASATVPSSSAVHGPQQHGAHRRRRARLRWMTSTNGAAPSVLQQRRGLATCWYRWPTSPWGVCRTPCNPPSLSHRACNLLVVRWESTPSVVTTWTWGRVLELPTTASCPCGPRPVGDVDKCFRRAAVSRNAEPSTCSRKVVT